MRYDLYKLDDRDEPRLWRSEVELRELFRAFGFIRVKDKLRDLRHLDGLFLTPEMFLIPTGKQVRGNDIAVFRGVRAVAR